MSVSRFSALIEHNLFENPETAFPDHALSDKDDE
jgi:hypothetical protein